MDHIAHIRIESNENNEVRVEEKVTEHSKKVAFLVDIYSSPFRMASCYLTSIIRIFDTQNTKSE